MQANWQLTFFSISDLAGFVVWDEEKQLLEWSYYHMSYATLHCSLKTA